MTPTMLPPWVMGRFRPGRDVGVACPTSTYSSGRCSSINFLAPSWRLPILVSSVLAITYPLRSIMLMFCPTTAPTSSTMDWAPCLESLSPLSISNSYCSIRLPPDMVESVSPPYPIPYTVSYLSKWLPPNTSRRSLLSICICECVLGIFIIYKSDTCRRAW